LIALAKEQASPGGKNDSRSLAWYLLCRTAVVTVLLGGAELFFLNGEPGRVDSGPFFLLIAITFVQALVFALLLKGISRPVILSQIQICWDLLFISALVVLSGGVESVFPFTYLLIVVAASFLLSRRMTVIAAAAAVILFGGILDLQYFGSLDTLGSLGLARGDVAAAVYLSTIFVHAIAFFLTAILSGTLAERWHCSERQLVQKNIDYAELEKMNRAILFQITSGLMLISPDAQIRTFNRAAAEITGYSFEEVFGEHFQRFFAALEIDFSPHAKILTRSECRFCNHTGKDLILGYATTPVMGRFGEYLGVLITFQDLTEVKKTEEVLKRVDRLAAVGRMAAGMAHEIRNPLAAISSSAQLLLETDDLKLEEQKLMGIVVKEADRLNRLLADFLFFARPQPVETFPVDVGRLIDDLVVMLKTDSRFRQITIEVDTPVSLVLDLDRGKIIQALWDLAVNAAEAIVGQGALHFRIMAEPRPQIRVEDDGPGVAEEDRARIFEPFYSTKEQGTGLGLAAVYTIMEAHQGQLLLETSELGGACFVLQF
jgi:two-component system sensor histidine kinase PilS (NtrC family)